MNTLSWIALLIFAYKALKFLIYHIQLHNFTTQKLKSKFPGKYAIVTGATGSLGYELARQLSKHYVVIAVGRNLQALQRLRAEFGAVPVQLDFSDSARLSEQLSLQLQHHGCDPRDIQLAFLNHGSGAM